MAQSPLRPLSPYLRSPRSENASENEFLTRRFVERAASNRLAVLQRKLQSRYQPRPWLVSPRRSTRHEASLRPLTPETLNSRVMGASYVAAPSRSMSASPLRGSYSSPMQSPAKQRKTIHQPLSPHHLFNDFIQLPLSGTYRHMDKLYGSGEMEKGPGVLYL
jgi:hypothetical protein